MTTRDPGSFRDPNGYVFVEDARVVRCVTAQGFEQFSKVWDSGVLQDLADKGLMIPCHELALTDSGKDASRTRYRGARGEHPAALFSHPLVPLITYPYEWTFGQLKAAALAHLDLQIAAFDRGFTLSDATAYNMQFVDGKPLHIDVLSLRPYSQGEAWVGYNQFCRQFLLPLLIEAWTGMAFQPIYRGSIEGISFADALAILPKRRLFTSLSGFLHVWLHGRSALAKKAANFDDAQKSTAQVKPQNYRAILQQLRGFIASLESKTRSGSYWGNYAATNSYATSARDQKLDFIEKWANDTTPNSVWDIGGNSGDFAMAAIKGGAKSAVVLDSDLDSLEHLFATRTQAGQPILPMVMNLTDPSSNMGWRQNERKGLNERANPDAVTALAVIHHLVLGANLPLSEVVDWLVSLAPRGVIEFVPMSDPMVQQIMTHRSEIFADYTYENFKSVLQARCDITSEQTVSQSDRILVSFVRKKSD